MERRIEELNATIRENEIYALDGKEITEDYVVYHKDTYTRIIFQSNIEEGVTENDLLEIVRDRFTLIQNSNKRNESTMCALYHLNRCLFYLNSKKEQKNGKQLQD